VDTLMTATGVQATIVTGVSSEIGAAILRRLVAEGHCAIGAYRSRGERAAALTADLDGPHFRACEVDLREPEAAAARLVEVCLDEFGSVSNIVNCAGEVRSDEIATAAALDALRLFRINALSPMMLVSEALRAKTGSRLRSVVNITSTSERYAWHGPSYEMSKAALAMLTRSLAYQLGPRGVRVNAVAPGAIDVDRNRLDPGWDAERIGALIPLRRVGTPRDVAGAVAFFLSDEASYVTGQTLFVDGGLSVRL
jgi:3-oxoacyl-[acyl-carrier protein] reductase